MSEYAAEVFDPRVVFFEIKKVDVARTVVSNDVHWVDCMSEIIKIAEEVD